MKENFYLENSSPVRGGKQRGRQDSQPRQMTGHFGFISERAMNYGKQPADGFNQWIQRNRRNCFTESSN
jgi:hypothetical protein